ncbi:MAG: GtrA family protein [Mariniphaga sp.]
MNFPNFIADTYEKVYRRIVREKFLIFLIVGGINTLFGYSIFALCIYLKLHYVLASVIAMILGILFNFKTTGIIVFKSNDNSLLLKFVSVYGISFCIGTFYLYLMNQFKISNYLSGAIWILPGAAIAYTLQRLLVFKK